MTDGVPTPSCRTKVEALRPPICSAVLLRGSALLKHCGNWVQVTLTTPIRPVLPQGGLVGVPSAT